MSTEESETRTRILAVTWRLMHEQQGQGVRMRDVAAAAGVSRQAVYLHFASRADLLIATTRYGDEINGLGDRLIKWRSATDGVDLLATFIDFWGNYIPLIYGIAKALLAARETDEAAAAAWEDRMDAVRDGCRITIEALERDGMLAPEWTCDEAIDMLWTLLSIRNWELLTVERGRPVSQYIAWMQLMAHQTFVKGGEDKVPSS